MNRFFIEGEWWREFPRRAFAKLDQIEPIVPEAAEHVRFGFDALEADWEQFGPEGAFNLRDDAIAGRQADSWKRAFGGDRSPGPAVHDQAPMYRIEFDLPRSHPWTERLLRSDETWVTLQLGNKGMVRAEVYGGLFAPAVEAFLVAEPAPAPESDALNALFGMDDWPDASTTELLAALDRRCDLTALVSFDIGQGAAAALVCACGYPLYYFDVGCGVYRNASTSPSTIQFCVCDSPPVLLSHWDADHWSGAHKDRALLGLTWIVPRQSISHIHTALGNDILAAGGDLLVVPLGGPPLLWGGHQLFDLRRCTGKGRNGSGLALVVTNRLIDRSWVLTGDAGYHQLPHPKPTDVAAMIAPHHGANMGPSSVPPLRSSESYARLMYSFGPGNAHGPTSVSHPTSSAVNAHSSSGWSHGAWPPSVPGHCVAGGDVLATAHHATIHLGAVGAGWDAVRPSIPHMSHCPRAMPVMQW